LHAVRVRRPGKPTSLSRMLGISHPFALSDRCVVFIRVRWVSCKSKRILYILLQHCSFV
jgi:hypothetical protein